MTRAYRTLQTLRPILRAVFTAGVVGLLLTAPRFWPAVRTLVGLSPWVAVAGLLAAGSAAVTWWAFFPAVASALRKRFLCRWLCPTGQCLDLLGAAGRRAGFRTPRCPRLNWWFALGTLGGACLGYPLVLWLDPLVLLTALFNAGRTQGEYRYVFIVVPAIVAGISVLAPGLWCARLCPLGGFQEFLFWIVRPWQWTFVRSVVRSVKQSHVESSAAAINTFAPADDRSQSEEATVNRAPWRTERRVVLAGALGAACGWAIGRRTSAVAAPPLRPPGAIDERLLTGQCVRCGNCIAACPEKILYAAGSMHSWAGLLVPEVRFDKSYCREDCVRCTTVCPSGALRPVKKREKVGAIIGFPRIDMNVCILGEDGECTACARACPFGAIRYEFREEDYTTVPRIDPARCPGCGACQLACPTKPKAIFIVAEHPNRPR